MSRRILGIARQAVRKINTSRTCGRSRPGSDVRVSASASNSRAFCGLRLSASEHAGVQKLLAAVDAARARARALHHRDALAYRLRHRREIGGGRHAGREARRDQPLGARGDEGAHRAAVGAGIGIGDVDARQRLDACDVELGIGHVAPLGLAIEGDAVGVGVAQNAEVRCAEGLHAPVRGLGHLARRLDLVVQQHQHAAAAARRIGRGAHAVHQVDRRIGRKAGGRPLRADHDHGNGDLEHQVQEPGGLLQCRGAVADHDAGKVGMLSHQAVAEEGEIAPFGKVDLGADHVAEIDRDHVGDLVHHRKSRDDGAGMHAVVVDAVVLQLQRMNAERGDGAAGADEGHFRLVGCCSGECSGPKVSLDARSVPLRMRLRARPYSSPRSGPASAPCRRIAPG